MFDTLPRSIAWGIAIGVVLVLVSHVGVIGFLIGLLIFIMVISMIDWSGQGDGREGCNRHTSCNHRHDY